MFPICDEQGRVIAFSGRVLSGDEKTAKYVNSPETEIFKKSKVFFGLDKSKRAILDAEFAIICEGQLDLIACFMAGVRNIVAPQGTAFTADHARILKRYVNEVVLCFDSDNAGQNAAVRVLDSLLASGLAVRVATVPAPHDPDSFIKERGGAAFRQLIAGARGFFDYLLERLCRENDLRSDRGRAAIVRGMGETVFKTGDAVLLDACARKTAQMIGIGVEAVRAEFKKARQAQRESSEPAAEAVAVTEIPLPSAQEFWLLRLVLQDDTLLDWAIGHLDLAWLEHPVVRRVLERRFADFTRGEWAGVPALLAELNDDAATRLVTEVVSEEVKPAEPVKVVMDAVKRVRDRSFERRLAELTRLVSDAATPATERAQAIQEQMELRRAKAAPLKPLGSPH
jgi:DNA primase